MSEKYNKSDKTFVNPYNFVSVDFKELKNRQKAVPVVQYAGSHESERLTGKLECTLYCKSPIAIPDTDPEHIKAEKIEKAGDHFTYPFMRVGEQAVIPGSSIRGVLRNVYETATDSCFSTMRPNSFLTKRNNRAAKAGILKKEGEKWVLYKSKRYMLKVKDFRNKNGGKNEDVWDERKCPCYKVEENKEGQKYIKVQNTSFYSGGTIYFSILTNDKQEEVAYINRRGIACGSVARELYATQGSERDTRKKGVLVLGEYIFNKHHESVFLDDGSCEEKITGKMLDDAIKGMERTIEMYRDSAINREYGTKHSGYSEYKKMKNDGCIPVWYINDDKGPLYLSMAALGRIAFAKTLNEHVGRKAPCKSREILCPACRLFGMVSQTDSGESDCTAAGSRVRISDAVIRSEGKFEKVTLSELGMPRSSYLPFYSTARANDYGNKDNPPGYDSKGVEIRGRKYYWHEKEVEGKSGFWVKNIGVEKTIRNATMEVLREDAEFTFTVYFDNVDADELNALIWAINLGDNEKKGDMCHKIGHGKPIGLGSVKLAVDKISFRTFDPEADSPYVIKDKCVDIDICHPESALINEESRTVNELMHICNFSNAQNTHYPYIVGFDSKELKQADQKEKNKYAPFHWFGENRMVRSGDQAKKKVQTLPKIQPGGLELKAMEFQGDNGFSGVAQRNGGFHNSGGKKNKKEKIYDAKITGVDSRKKELTIQVNGKEAHVSYTKPFVIYNEKQSVKVKVEYRNNKPIYELVE